MLIRFFQVQVSVASRRLCLQLFKDIFPFSIYGFIQYAVMYWYLRLIEYLQFAVKFCRLNIKQKKTVEFHTQEYHIWYILFIG